MNIKWILNKYFPDSKYEYASNVVLAHEGYFSDDKNDPGGATQWGISLRFLQRAGIHVLDHDVIDLQDVKAISRKDAKAIYYTYFWKKYFIDTFLNVIVATKILDMAINMGIYQTIKLLQKALNNINLRPVIVDGDLGPETMKSANSCDPNILHLQLIAEQRLFYLDLIDKKPYLACFKQGWLNRAAW